MKTIFASFYSFHIKLPLLRLNYTHQPNLPKAWAKERCFV